MSIILEVTFDSRYYRLWPAFSSVGYPYRCAMWRSRDGSQRRGAPGGFSCRAWPWPWPRRSTPSSTRSSISKFATVSRNSGRHCYSGWKSTVVSKSDAPSLGWKNGMDNHWRNSTAKQFFCELFIKHYYIVMVVFAPQRDWLQCILWWVWSVILRSERNRNKKKNVFRTVLRTVWQRLVQYSKNGRKKRSNGSMATIARSELAIRRKWKRRKALNKTYWDN